MRGHCNYTSSVLERQCQTPSPLLLIDLNTQTLIMNILRKNFK